MAAGVLQHVSLAYQLLWNAQRQVAGVQLCLDPHDDNTFDTGHLLKTLSEVWRERSVPLLLSTQSNTLLADLLDLTPPSLARIEVSEASLENPAIASRVMRAKQRGLQLLWRGEPGTHLKAAYAASFAQSLLSLSAEEALIGLHASLQRNNSGNQASSRPSTASPVHAEQIYEGIANRALAAHCLDQQGAAALLGWPVEDVLYGYHQRHIAPSRDAIARLVRAIDADGSMDDIERQLSQEPMLAYRFLRFANSAGLGLSRDIDALRQGVMVLGLRQIRSWLREQNPKLSDDADVQPVRTAMVLRAQLMAELLDAGQGEALKRELYLCGLLSQIDLLLGEPLTVALRAIPLPERVTSAILDQSGPYWPYLEMATALESPHTTATHALCVAHGFDEEEVNLALLRTLAALRKSAD